jgi:hypothetical protein
MRADFETYLNDILLSELLRFVEETEGLAGDLLECGVYKGGTSTIIGLKLKSLGSRRKLHAIDSFKGFPEPTQYDHQASLGRSTGDWKIDAGYVRDKLQRFGVEGYVFVYEGWLEEVLPHLDAVLVNGSRSFSFVFIDVDLYEPTKACCEYLWDKLESDGIMVFDDYENARFPGVKKAVDEFFVGKPERPRPLSYPTWYVRKSASRAPQITMRWGR